MANQFQNIKDDNWSLGVDALSTEVDISEGYVEEIENFDPTPEKYLSKRRGYQGVFGNLPVRVMSVEYKLGTTDNLCFTLDGSIDLSRILSTPIVVEGKLSVATTGDFSDDENSVHYYASFTTEVVKTFENGTHTLVVPASEHSLDTAYIWTAVSSSTDSSTISNSQFIPAQISVDQVSTDISVTYTNGTPDFTGYVAYLDRSPSAGVTYVSSPFVFPNGTSSFSITSGTHQLSNNQILVKSFIDDGTSFIEVIPESVTIQPNGTVTVVITNGGLSTNIFFILSDAALSNSMTGTIDSYDTIPVGPKTLSVTLPVTSPFFFVSCYLEVGANLEQVIPDSITYDDVTKTASVSFENNGPATSFSIYWIEAQVSANKLCVDATPILSAIDDPRPQLNIWGLDHATIYGSNAAARAGWVTHIDTYRSEGEQFLVAGLGGVFYKGQERDTTSGPAYLMPAAYPNLRNRINGSVSVGPVFIDITDTPYRTRGQIQGDNLAAGFARVSSYTWNSGTGLVDVVMNIPDLTVVGSIGTVIDLTPDLEDRATIQQSPFARLNGTWVIKTVVVGVDQLTLSLEIPDVTSSDYDDAGGVGELGIFTDRFTLASTSSFIQDDIILSESIPNGLPITCLFSDGTTLVVSGATQQVNFPNAIRIAGSRVSDTIPIRDLNGNPTVAGFVVGDMIVVGDYAREFRIVGIDIGEDTITVDEIFRWDDAVQSTNLVSVTGRWVPFEAPEDNFSDTPSTYITYMSESPYDDQPFVHSSMANDSMYLTNGVDRPQKIDGVNIYRPGLPRWQSQMFVTKNTAAAAKIQLNNVSSPVTGWATNKFTVAAEDVKTFPIGTRIRRDGDDQTIYVVTDVDTTNNVIIVNLDITGVTAADVIREVCTLSYYFRLNMVDRNNNIIASAATGSQDCVLELTEDAQVRIRLLGLPSLDNYDYDRIEVTVNRTKKNGVAPYYNLATIPLNFNTSGGYIDYIDTDADEDLRDFDQVNTALKGAELGVAWSPPLRSKFLTSVSNSLIQGNFKSDPYLDIRFVDTGARITASVLSGFRFLFKKDINDALTTSDMINRVGTEWRDSGRLSVTSISPGTTDFDASITAHGAAVGDWVYLFRFATPVAASANYYAGWFQIAAVPDANTITVNLTDPQPFVAGDVDSALFATLPGDLPVWLGTDYNYDWRREVGAPTSPASPYERLAVLRLASAMNAGMRMTDTTIAGFETFMPWYVTDAGGEYDIGEILFRQPLNIDTGSSVVLPPAFGDYTLFINSVKVEPSQEVGVQVQSFGSRLLASYQNFPEIVDNPTALVDSQSDSAVDVNPADGQDITAIIPLFGQAAFGAAQKDQIVLAFKANSIYIVNFTEKRAGRNAVQRIQSENLGCNSPNAVTTTKGGVVYANRSGIFKLDASSMEPMYLGRRLQRIWREQVDLDNLDVFTVTNFSSESKIKLSFLYKGDSVPTNQFVYNTTKENLADDSALGSWTTYSNWNAIGFANLDANNYNATTYGRVFSTRDLDEVSDYRDDSAPIVANVLMRAMSFGDEGRRKTVPAATITYRNQENQGIRDVQVFYSINMQNTFDEADPSSIPNRGPVNDLSDQSGQRSVVYKYSFHDKKGVYFQLRIINDKIDQSLDITNVTYRVAGLTGQGIANARQG